MSEAVILSGTTVNTASAARVGARRTMPLVLGITMGVGLMFIAMALGLHALLEQLPMLDSLLRLLATTVLMWIAWKILNAGPLTGEDERPLLGFLGGAGFQWINPKAWAITGSAATLYLSVPASAGDIALRATSLVAVGTCLVSM